MSGGLVLVLCALPGPVLQKAGSGQSCRAVRAATPQLRLKGDLRLDALGRYLDRLPEK